MRALPTGVAVVMVHDGGHLRGLTVGSLASTSLDPPLVSFNIRRASRLAPTMAAAPAFAVSVLSADQAPVSDRFAGRPGAAGSRIRWSDAGLPFIEGSVASLECARHAVYPAGDHLLILGEVRRAEAREAPPLLYLHGSYARVVAAQCAGRGA